MSASSKGKIGSVAELLAHSLLIETEAAERYSELADQMEVHNNREVAELFRRLENVENRHVTRIRELTGDMDLPHLAPWEYGWGEADSPEALEADQAHYLMTPHHALSLALAAEERAARFFVEAARTADDEQIRDLATQLAAEENEHVALIKQRLAKYPAPAPGWDEDPDPPTVPE